VSALRDLLAAGTSGPDCVPLRLADSIAIPNRRHCRTRSVGPNLGSGDVPGQAAERTVPALDTFKSVADIPYLRIVIPSGAQRFALRIIAVVEQPAFPV
jgi:hypothetical protein